MSITTYGELKTAVANFLSRGDLTARIPEFIAMAEGWIAHGLELGALRAEPLRIRAMETAATLTVNAQSVALPTRFLGKRRLYLETSPARVLDFYAPEAFHEAFAAGMTGIPAGYTIEGDTILFGPAPDGPYTAKILYYQQPAAFAADADSNAILVGSPQIHLLGSLLASTLLIQGHPMAETWLAGFVGSVNARNAADRKDRYGGAALVSRVASAP